MELQKINVKFFTEEKAPIPLTAFIDIFHSWIQATDGIYHDVADYSHMQAGPGIVLVAEGANLSIDETEHRRGLVFCQKSRRAGSNQEKLRAVLRSALENCRRLEQEPALRGKLKFSPNEILMLVNDRLIAVNTEESFEEIKSEIESVGRLLFGETGFILNRDRDPRKRLNVRIKSSRPVELETLLSNLRALDGE
jgi:hypothetical protein